MDGHLPIRVLLVFVGAYYAPTPGRPFSLNSSPPQGVNFLILDGIRLTGRDGWGGAGGIDPNRATYVRAFHFFPHRKVPGSTDLSRLALKVVFQTLNPCGDGVKVDPHATPYSYF